MAGPPVECDTKTGRNVAGKQLADSKWQLALLKSRIRAAARETLWIRPAFAEKQVSL
jgi:hypothetical protein